MRRYKYLLLSCLATLIVVELFSFGAIRLFVPEISKTVSRIDNPFHPFLGWTHRSNRRIKADGMCVSKNNGIRTDDEGYSIVPIRYDSPQLTILITGGSSVFGVGSSENSTTIPTQIAEILRSQVGVHANVINLARRGYNSFQELGVLNEWVALHPNTKVDLVLSISGVNDSILGYSDPDQQFSLLPRFVFNNSVAFVRNSELGGFPWRGFYAFLKKNLSSVQLGVYIIKKSSAFAVQMNTSTDRSDMVERAKLAAIHYSSMAGLSSQLGANYLMILQPSLGSKLSSTDREWSCANATFGAGDLSLYENYEREFYRAFRELPKNFEFVDISPFEYGANIDTFVDSCHYNDRGANLVAKKVVEVLKERNIFSNTSR